ncbi:MAG: YraN family protein [Pseudomonadota bacterium]|nr:MAG: YraN family protein [Pseudomonadota bacterium]
MRRSKTGSEAEQLACNYLNSHGLRLVERNFRAPWGEIDLVMQHGEQIVFVEVRYRRDTRYGTGAETVDRKKQTKLVRTALYFLQNRRGAGDIPARFDVISITGEGASDDIDWIRDAFQA